MAIPRQPSIASCLPLVAPLSCLLSLLFTSASFAAGVPAPAASSVPNGDPCGPAIQDNPNYPNTCNAIPALVAYPSPYGINCTQVEDPIKYPAFAVSWGDCEASINDICTKMEDSRTLAGTWVWSTLAPQCSLGFFLPPYTGSASIPSAARCAGIFEAMNNTCATTVLASNFGGVNLKTLPGYDPSYFDGGGNVTKGYPGHDYKYDGAAVNVGYPSYAITFMTS